GDEMVKSDSGCTGDLDWWLALICAFSRYQETVGKSQTHSARQIVDVYPLLFRQSTPTLREGRDRSGAHRHAAADRCHRATSRRGRLFRRRRGYSDLGNTFDVRDLQGGLVTRTTHLHDHREQVKSMIRATLRSMDFIMRNEAAVVPYLQKDFGLQPKLAVDTYKILKQVVNSDGDIEDPVLKSIIDKIRQESGITAEIPADRLTDLSLLREVRKR